MRDRANNGVTRKEAISFIQLISSSNFKTAENHFDYLVTQKRFSNLKCEGKTVKAQKTTTKRSQIRTETQLRWHLILDTVWNEVKRFNVLPTGSTKTQFENVWEYFWLNLDKTCIVADDGNVCVLSEKTREVTAKRMSDSKFSITILRVGSAAGCDGPIIFLVKGEKIECEALKDIVKNFGCPPGSCVIPTPTAYMTDKAWNELIPKLIEGIRAMPGIRDYPEFKALISFDG